MSYIILFLFLFHSSICSLFKDTNFLFFLATFPSPKPISSLLSIVNLNPSSLFAKLILVP
jgi:hypothetical protein